MKVKADFVTNSSTTSFVAWGIAVEFSVIRESSILLQQMYLAYVELQKKHGNEAATMDDWLSGVEDHYEFQEDLRTLLRKEGQGFECASAPYDDTLYIGVSPFSMKDDETFAEFKTRVANTLEKIGLPSNAGSIEEAWRDG